MRYGSNDWLALANDESRELVLVIKIDFPTPLYLTSGTVDGLSGRVLSGVLSDVSSQSQKINPEQGRSEIGSIKFDVIDDAGLFTAALRDELANNVGIKGKKVELYSGFAGLDFSFYRLEQTQIVDKDITVNNGELSVSCADVQRTLRQTIFNKASTVLVQSATDDDTTIYVASTNGFDAVPHFPSNSTASSGSYYYFSIKYNDGIEVVRATGKTATSFTGCERGYFQTTAREHTLGESGDEGVKVEEWVYLELPAPAMAYALMTGKLINESGTHTSTLPDSWHLGIDEQYVDIEAFRNVGRDWFIPGDYSKGKILRFDNPKSQDGKRFIERQIMLVLGAFMPIRADGSLSIKRMTGVLSSASYSQVLDESNVVRYGTLKSDLSRVSNSFVLDWAYFTGEDNKPTYLRRNRLVDAGSIARHGLGKEIPLKFEGLHNARHTFSTIKNSFDALRDRYAGPPLTIKLDLLPNITTIEVGDVVRVRLGNVTDPNTGEGLDRSFEVQSVRLDQNSGSLSVDLFGSSERADPIEDAGADISAELPDAWYNAVGVNLSTVANIDGSGFLQSDVTLTGATDQFTVYYYTGDLTIPVGRTITTTENVEIRVRGVLTNNGTIKAVSDNRHAAFLGTTVGGEGTVVDNSNNTRYYRRSKSYPYSFQLATTQEGYHDSFPVIELVNNGGELEGLPDDQRGSGGGKGADGIVYTQHDQIWETVAIGGAGGDGGGGLRIISRGMGFGANGEIDTSGEDGIAGVSGVGVGGSGDGGAPGGVLILIDGNQNPFPILTNNTIVSRYGISPGPQPGTHRADESGNGQLMGAAVARAYFVPTSRVAYPEYSKSEAVKGAQVFQQDDEPTNADSRAIAKRALKAGDIWFDSDDNNRQYTFNGSTWIAGAASITKEDVTGTGISAAEIGGETPTGAQAKANDARDAAVENAAADDRTRNSAFTFGENGELRRAGSLVGRVTIDGVGGVGNERFISRNRRDSDRNRTSRMALIESQGDVFKSRFTGARQKLDTKRAEERAIEAKDYALLIATEKATEAQDAALKAADAKAKADRVRAEAYADGKVTAEEERAIARADADVLAAQAYADARKIEAEAHADGIVTQAEQDAIDTAYEQAQILADAAEQAAKDASDPAGSAAQAEQNAKDYADINFVDAVTYSTDIAAIQAQVDGSIVNWFYDGVPTLLNNPAVNWTDDATKDVHLGDTYYDNLTGYAYRFVEDGSSYKWQLIENSDISQALAAASAAQDTADSKRRVFVVQPVPPYDIGDLWDTGSGIKRATVDKANGTNYDAADWVLVGDVTDYANASIANSVLDETELTSRLGWTTKPEDGANNTTDAHIEQRADSRINALRDDNWVYTRADSRVEFLRPDPEYKNSNTTKADVGLANVVDGADITNYDDERVSNAVLDEAELVLRLNWQTKPEDGANKTTDSHIDSRANARISSLRPDADYRNENTDPDVIGATRITAFEREQRRSISANRRVLARESVDRIALISSQGETLEAKLKTAKQKLDTKRAEEKAVEAKDYALLIATEKSIEAQDAALKAADAKAKADRVRAEAYADNKVTEEEQRAIARADADALAAQAYADARKIEAEAHADGIVTLAEQDAIDTAYEQAQILADAAEQAAKDASDPAGSAAAARTGAIQDAKSDAELANSQQQWSQVSGTGKPADNADVTDYDDNRISNAQALIEAKQDDELRNSWLTDEVFSNVENKSSEEIRSELTSADVVNSNVTPDDINAARNTDVTPISAVFVKSTDQSIPTNANSGIIFSFTSEIAGDGWIHVKLRDADGNMRFKLTTGTSTYESGGLSGGNNVTKWFSLRVNLQVGTNTVDVWSPTSDAGRLYGVVVTRGGRGDPEAMLTRSLVKEEQRSLPQVISAGLGSEVNAVPMSATDAGSTATISLSAHTRYYGGFSSALNSGSITGLNFSTKYYIYYDDADYNGGAVSYLATTNKYTAASGIGRVYVGKITTPSNGGGPTPPPDIDDFR